MIWLGVVGEMDMVWVGVCLVSGVFDDDVMFVYWFQYFKDVFEFCWNYYCIVWICFGCMVLFVDDVVVFFEDVEIFIFVGGEGNVLAVFFVGLDVGVYFFVGIGEVILCGMQWIVFQMVIFVWVVVFGCRGIQVELIDDGGGGYDEEVGRYWLMVRVVV